PVAVITSWIIGFIVGIVLGISASGDPATAAMTADGYRINAGIDALRVLVMIAIMAFGAWMVFDTAKKKLSACASPDRGSAPPGEHRGGALPCPGCLAASEPAGARPGPPEPAGAQSLTLRGRGPAAACAPRWSPERVRR